MRPPEPPPLPAELTTVLARLRLPYIRRAAPEVLATARAQRWDPAETLRILLAEEAAGRDAATKASRRRAAGFPTGKTLESWQEAESAAYSTETDQSVQGFRSPSVGGREAVDGEPGLSP